MIEVLVLTELRLSSIASFTCNTHTYIWNQERKRKESRKIRIMERIIIRKRDVWVLSQVGVLYTFHRKVLKNFIQCFIYLNIFYVKINIQNDWEWRFVGINHIKFHKIKFLCKYESSEFKIIKNESSLPLINWWRIFYCPEKSNKLGVLERISGYVNCFNCHGAYIYGTSSGTARLK